MRYGRGWGRAVRQKKQGCQKFSLQSSTMKTSDNPGKHPVAGINKMTGTVQKELQSIQTASSFAFCCVLA